MLTHHYVQASEVAIFPLLLFRTRQLSIIVYPLVELLHCLREVVSADTFFAGMVQVGHLAVLNLTINESVWIDSFLSRESLFKAQAHGRTCM